MSGDKCFDTREIEKVEKYQKPAAKMKKLRKANVAMVLSTNLPFKKFARKQPFLRHIQPLF